MIRDDQLTGVIKCVTKTSALTVLQSHSSVKTHDDYDREMCTTLYHPPPQFSSKHISSDSQLHANNSEKITCGFLTGTDISHIERKQIHYNQRIR